MRCEESALTAEQGKKLGDALFSETFDEEVRPYFAIDTSAYTAYKEGFYAVFKIPVTGGTKIVWKCGHSTANEVTLTEYGSDNTRKAINKNATTDKTITLNAATTYINASFKSDYADAGIFTEDGTAIWAPDSVAGLKQRVEKLEGGASYDMVEDIDVTYTDGYVIGFDGAATALTDGRISDFIPVKAGETYKVGGNQHNATPAYLIVCGYSSNDESTAIPTAFPFVLATAACAVYNITIPSGVNYIRLSNYNRNGARLDALTSYKPFIGLKRYYKHDDAMSNEVQSLKVSNGVIRDMWASDGMYINNTIGTYGSIKCFKITANANVTSKLAFVPCSSGDRFTINTTSTIGNAVAFYDASLTKLWDTTAPYSSVLTAPTNAAWLVLNLAATDTGNYVGADRLDGLSIWRGTQAQYDAMSSHDNNILYLIVE